MRHGVQNASCVTDCFIVTPGEGYDLVSVALSGAKGSCGGMTLGGEWYGY